MKVCTICRNQKNYGEFYVWSHEKYDPARPGKWLRSWCKKCFLEKEKDRNPSVRHLKRRRNRERLFGQDFKSLPQYCWRCHHIWLSRLPNGPKGCPKCKAAMVNTGEAGRRRKRT